MKKKLLLVLSMIAVFSCLLALAVSAEVVEYDDFGNRTTVPASTHDLVVFYDGLTCPSAYIVKDQKGLSLTFDYVSGKAQKTYTVADIKELDIPEGIETIGQYFFQKNTTLKKCSIPASVTKLEQCIFQEATGIEELVFEHTEDSALDHFPNWMVWGCTSLKAFSMPDCITQMTGVGQFNSCSNLTALYLSKNLTSINSGAGTTASFGFCPKLFFVSEPFTYDNVPTEKPSVYYFPENLTSLPSGGEVFKNCTSLNDVLVFPKGVTEIANGWAFNGANAISIVFLGNMTNISTTGNAWSKSITIYFCNENDVSADSLTMNTSANKVFCYGEGNTTHKKELSKATDATCELPKMVADYCFCGAIMGEPETEGVALGHSYTGAVTYAFTTVTANGEKCTACVNGCGIDLVEALEPVYTELGFSANTTDFAITNGYKIDRESLALYEAQKGVTLKLGFAFNAAESFTDGEVTLDSFKLKAEVHNQYNGVEYSFHDLKISFTDDKHVNDNIIVGVYVVEKNGEDETVSFINRTCEDGVNGFEAVSYNSLISK